jgi:hypothetical protein
MKKLLLILFCLPIFCYSQISIGNDQTICLGNTAQIIATLSGTSGCNGAIDSLASDIGPSNGSNGTMFNIINTSGSDVTITGFSQGTYTYSGARTMNIWYYPGDYVPVMSATTGWTQVATAVNINLPVGATTAAPLYSPIIPITSVIIPAGATYGFYIGASSTLSYATAPTGTISGVSPWGSNSLLTITVGHGGNFPSPINTPRGPLIKVYYGGGVAWYDITGQMIGSGDTLYYSPTQSTGVLAIFDCNGQSYIDTMTLHVLNTAISSTGFSLCNGALVLTAPTGFSTYTWNGPSTTGVLTVSTPGIYYVNCVTANGVTCQSDPITIYSGNIPITLSTPDSVFICQGDTVVIDGPLGFSNYFWSTGAINSSITTTSTGNYSLSVLDGNGCTGTSNTTSVIMSPQTITATTTGFSLCNGPVTLDAGSGYGSYQWYLNNSPLLNAINQTYIVNINSPGSYYVSVVYPTGCTAASNSLQITSATGQFSLTINAIGADSLCLPNGSIILDAGNYATYQWGTNGATIQGATTQTITITSVGVYYVNVTDTNGCQGVSNPPFSVASYIVNTSSISGPTNPIQYQNVTYSVNPSISSTYNWTLNGGTILSGQGTNSIDLEWINSGNLSISVVETDVNGCVGDTVFLSVFVIISAVDEENPTSHKLKKVTDVLGRKTPYKKRIPLFYIYDDGTVEKKIIIE